MDLPQILFSFSGRLNRLPYWGVSIGAPILAVLVLTIAGVVLPDFLMTIGTFGFAVAYLWMGFAVGVKRAHDRGRAWWFVLLGAVPVLNLWPIVELGFLRGTVGDNQYGADPLGG